KTVGLMATDGTVKAGFYPKKLARSGIQMVLPEEALQRNIMHGIYQVKSGKIEAGGEILAGCMEQMLRLGVEKVILGCTEIPLALERIESPLVDRGIDATQALAAACVRWHGAFRQRSVA
ncbi:aspartate/glutamate racemase family protein, partial [Marinobacter sp.]